MHHRLLSLVAIVGLFAATITPALGFIGDEYVKELANRGPRFLPDLQVYNVQRLNASTIQFVVANTTTVPPGSFHITVSDEDSGRSITMAYRMISMGADVVQAQFDPPLSEGSHRIRVSVDPFHEVDEINEDNNVVEAFVGDPGAPAQEQRVAAGAFSMDYRTTYRFYGSSMLWLPNFDVLEHQGVDQSSMVALADDQLALYPQIKLAKIRGESRVFYLTPSHLKRLIPNEEVFNSYPDFHWNDIVTVTLDDLNTYKANDIVRWSGDPHLYKLENGIKRAFVSEQTASDMGYDVSLAEWINKTEFDSYPTGAIIR